MPALFTHPPVLLRLSGEASILIILILTAQWLLGPRLKPRWRSALWILVLLRLALPNSIPSPASLFNVLKIRATAQPQRLESGPALTLVGTVSRAESVTQSLPSSVHWLPLLWVMGASVVATFAATSQFRFHRRLGRLRPLLDEPTLRLLEECKALMGLSTPVTLAETPAVASPTLFGFLRPRLLLPAGLATAFSREELRHVFLHELAHLKRLDILTGWVTLGLQIIHWFNPLVWLAFHRLRVDRELACDALALSYAGAGANESYGLTIVKLMEGSGQPFWGPSLAGILENKHQIKERIRMIAKFHKTDRGLALAIGLLAGLALVTLTDAQNEKTPPSAPIEPDAAKGVWAVRFEAVGDFSPKTPGDFLQRVHIYTGHDGQIGYFRTRIQGGKLTGSFLAYDADQLKAALEKVPGIKVVSVEKLTAETL
ncbi:MAG TPA: M56 family metallopeptidase, partial [Candidatus Acidoferrales bacterium]|nr:M56 family metallopeptidase [Candidatus Acidoferrales bacterium]